MKARFRFAGQEMTAVLEDNPTARDFFGLTPLDLRIEDYSTNEKIAFLPRKLTEAGAGVFGNERPGDLCCYAPWGNLALFHGAYVHSRGLIRLGRFEEGHAPLLTRGRFALRIEAIG